MNIDFIDSSHSLYPAVKRLGTKYKATLGFMPDGGFDDYAARRNIVTASEGGELMGYLMYREVKQFSRVTIVHLAVDDPFRGKGVSTMLINALKKRFKDTGVAGISLSCRRDFEKPSEVWERNDFIAKWSRRSRSFEEHYLTTWWYDFNPRTLFSMMYEESSKVRALMDANIIMKLRDAGMGIKFKNAKENPCCLLQDWLVDETELCYAPEVFNEINRDKDIYRGQTTRDYVNSAFTQALFDTEKKTQIANDLEEMLPGKSVNTISDRKQVASCIAAGIPYFITYDEAVIKKRDVIKASYDVEIYTPQEFVMKIDKLLHREDYSPSLLKGVAFHTVSQQAAADLNANIDYFLQKRRSERKLDFENMVNGCVNEGGKLITVNFQEQKLAFYGIKDDNETSTIHFLRLAEGALSASLMCQIVTDKLRECAKKKRRFIVLKEKYLAEEQKDFLENLGFIQQAQESYVKQIRAEIVAKTSQPWKNLSNYELVQVERMLFPLKIRDLDIKTYIIPIWPRWAGQLFDSTISSEDLFGADPEKLWSFENVYYRHTKPITEVPPARILWYVSGHGEVCSHSKAIVGCSYLMDVKTGKAKDLFKLYKHYGIYVWKDIYELCNGKEDSDIRALKFSHTELFTRPIVYEKVQLILKKHGYRRNTFASPLAVNNDVFIEMYEMGRP